MIYRHSSIFISMLFMFCTQASAAVNDVFPTDYIAMKDGTLNTTFYLGHRELQGPYINGHKLLDGRIDTDLAAIRLSYHMDVGEHHTFAPVAVMTWAGSHTGPRALSRAIGDESKGLTDLRLGGSFWFHRDFDKRQYAAVSMFAALPTGHYDENQILNAGENRWKWIMSGGLMLPIGNRLVIDVSPEIAWYGDNKDYLASHRLEQDVSYALTGYLRYKITPDFQLVTGAQVNRGGATRIDGKDLNNAPENTRLSLGVLFFTPARDQWQVRYSHDSSTEYGFKTMNEIVVRLTTQF